MSEPYFTDGYWGGNIPLVLQIDDETDNTDRKKVL